MSFSSSVESRCGQASGWLKTKMTIGTIEEADMLASM
jgi:hypothetical protein